MMRLYHYVSGGLEACSRRFLELLISFLQSEVLLSQLFPCLPSFLIHAVSVSSLTCTIFSYLSLCLCSSTARLLALYKASQLALVGPSHPSRDYFLRSRGDRGCTSCFCKLLYSELSARQMRYPWASLILETSQMRYPWASLIIDS